MEYGPHQWKHALPGTKSEAEAITNHTLISEIIDRYQPVDLFHRQ
jgi:hypothetical protein